MLSLICYTQLVVDDGVVTAEDCGGAEDDQSFVGYASPLISRVSDKRCMGMCIVNVDFVSLLICSYGASFILGCTCSW